ncbi:hypothetical protein PIB30_041760 [Stylosanthes scabra]|uniref:Uncharacterized protein n=1 Tax=Stylosanthes scabra TaxID=79078 RepID=A0ABU6SEW2_9FABA|nr:hypothetical protein [Stylosanthes scabra]
MAELRKCDEMDVNFVNHKDLEQLGKDIWYSKFIESSSSYDSYENAENKTYKPPPPGYESDDGEEDSPMKSRKAQGKFVSPRKKIHTLRKRIYAGKRKDHHILSGSGSGSGGGVGFAGGSFSGDELGNASDARLASGSADGPGSGSASGPTVDDDNLGPIWNSVETSKRRFLMELMQIFLKRK